MMFEFLEHTTDFNLFQYWQIFYENNKNFSIFFRKQSKLENLVNDTVLKTKSNNCTKMQLNNQ